MKILFLTDDYPEHGGSSVAGVVRTLDHGLRDAGHAIAVITTHRTKESDSILRRGHVVSLPVSYRQSLRHYHCLHIPAVSRMLDEEIFRIHPDIVHAHNVHQYITYDALRVARRHVKKAFITLHDVMSFSYGRLATDRYLQSEGADIRTSCVDHLRQIGVQWNPLRNVIIRRMLRKNMTAVFAVSAALKRALDAHRIPHVQVLPNGTDVSSWQASSGTIATFRAKHGLVNRRVIFFGGRLSHDKGSVPLLAALRKIRETIPEVMLLVIGDAMRLRGLIVEAGAEDLLPHVRCVGWLPQVEMAAAYGAADVVTTPSLCLDTFNLINIEAMSAGKPVVGTTFGGTPEIVIDGVTGYVRNPLKIDAYTDALRTLLEDPLLAEQMGQAGRKRVKEHFSLDRMIDAHLQHYLADEVEQKPQRRRDRR